MSENRRLLIALGCAILAVSCVALLEWYYVGAALARYTNEVGAVFQSMYSWPFKMLGSQPTTALAAPAVDLGSMPTRQAELSLTRSTMGILSALTIFGGCLAVSLFTPNKWPSIVVAAYGWFLNGAIGATMTARALKLIGDLPKTFSSPMVTWRSPASGGPPFALYVLLGLFSAMVWQGLVPWVAGWGIGTGIRMWRVNKIDFLPAAPPQPAVLLPAEPTIPQRCVCGAINLPTSRTCYACGASLESAGALGTENA